MKDLKKFKIQKENTSKILGGRKAPENTYEDPRVTQCWQNHYGAVGWSYDFD